MSINALGSLPSVYTAPTPASPRPQATPVAARDPDHDGDIDPPGQADKDTSRRLDILA